MKKYLPALTLAALAFVPLSKGEQISPVRSAAIHERLQNMFSMFGKRLNSRCMELVWQSTGSALTN
jgi:hypothetical protein